MANLLKDKEDCSFFDLVNKKWTIESSLIDVYVDVSKNSVFTSIENHPKMFSWANERIHKVKGSENLFRTENIDNYFNEDIEEEIRATVISIIQK